MTQSASIRNIFQKIADNEDVEVNILLLIGRINVTKIAIPLGESSEHYRKVTDSARKYFFEASLENIMALEADIEEFINLIEE